MWMCCVLQFRTDCTVHTAICCVRSLPIRLLLKNMTCSVSFCLHMDFSKNEWSAWFEVVGNEVYRSMEHFRL